MDFVKEFYNHYDEDGRLLRKSRKPEYLLTMEYIEKYLFDGAKVLEIGAGTGRYSITLADMGYDVTAVELVPHNIAIMKKKVKAEHQIRIIEGNAVDLPFLPDETFDLVLLLGPMYHLFTDEEKHAAISEAIRVAKPGGVIYAAYINNDTCMYKFFYDKRILGYLDKGVIRADYHAESVPSEVFELYRKPDIDALMERYPVTRLHFVGVDMLTYLFNNRLDRLNKREFAEYMRFLHCICERDDMTGFSIHMLDIFRKNEM